MKNFFISRKFVILVKIVIMYTYSDYNCPWCGWEMDYEDPDLKREEWGYICPKCNKYFETPDV